MTPIGQTSHCSSQQAPHRTFKSKVETELSSFQTETFSVCVCVCSFSGRRQTAALELLESERVYVSHLSLLLKANISFNGSDALVSKDKRSVQDQDLVLSY